MNEYYCRQCAIDLGELKVVPKNFNPTSQGYQMEKWVKHHIPILYHTNPTSIFDGDEGRPYKDYIVNTEMSGCMEIDEQRRKNFIWIAGKKQGYKTLKGNVQGDEDGVKVVLPDDPDKIHAFPIAGSSLSITKCAWCGRVIIFPQI